MLPENGSAISMASVLQDGGRRCSETEQAPQHETELGPTTEALLEGH